MAPSGLPGVPETSCSAHHTTGLTGLRYLSGTQCGEPHKAIHSRHWSPYFIYDSPLDKAGIRPIPHQVGLHCSEQAGLGREGVIKLQRLFLHFLVGVASDQLLGFGNSTFLEDQTMLHVRLCQD